MRIRVAGIVIATLCVLVGAFAACTDNGEGERCDFDNGNQDCLPGLVCVPSTSVGNRGVGYGVVNAPYNTSDRCCPFPRSSATHPACVVNQFTDAGGFTLDSSIPDGSVEASTDATTDAPVDASTDAPTDAPDAG